MILGTESPIPYGPSSFGPAMVAVRLDQRWFEVRIVISVAHQRFGFCALTCGYVREASILVRSLFAVCFH